MTWHRATVAEASAALLYNLLPEIQKLPAQEQYRRLVDHMHGCINAFEDMKEDFRLPEPSEN